MSIAEIFEKSKQNNKVSQGASSNSSASLPQNNSNLASIFANNSFQTITNQSYITSQVANSGNTSTNIRNLNSEIARRNQAEWDDNVGEDGKYKGIHGMSEREYDEYQAWMYYAYGIEVENLSVGNFQSAAVSMERAIGKQWADEMAASYDTVLDLVLDEKLNQAMDEIFGEGTMPGWDSLYGARNTLFKEYGILIDCLDPNNTHKTYSVSLVDENGNVIQDENGKLAQTIKNDLLMPDGLAQINEIFNSAVLDMMGYDCASILDLSPEEYQMIKEMASLSSSELGTSSGYKGSNGHALRNKVRDDLRAKNGVDSEGKIIKTDATDWLNGTYVDKYNDETIGRKAYWRRFESNRDSGYFRTRINNVTGESANWKNKSITRNIYANYEATGEFSNGKITTNAGSYRASGSSNNGSSNPITDGMIQNQESLAEMTQTEGTLLDTSETREKTKIKISASEFENKVQNVMESKGTTETRAKELVGEKYEIDYSLVGKQQA